MKKLLMFAFMLILFSSCEKGFEANNEVKPNSRVPIDYSDSTKWINTKTYYHPNEIYVRFNKDNTYHFTPDFPLGSFFLFACFIFLVGVVVGIKMAE